MNKIINLRTLAAVVVTGGAIFLAGCSKEKIATTGAGVPSATNSGKKIVLTDNQARDAKEMYAKMPKLRYWDAAHHRFIELKPGSRDLVFSDPDSGFEFNDTDGNGAVTYSDGNGDYLVVSSGIGLAGQGGGGTVVAGNSALDIDVTVCLSAEAVSNGDGFGDLFDTGFGFSNFSAVFGISGDFDGLANADTGADDFNPFDYLHGFACYYVLSDNVEGSHDVFDWLAADGTENYDDLASSFVMDFNDFSLYFSNGGTIDVSGGQMNFNGTYLAITDLFDSFLNDGVGDDPTVNEVSGFGTMGCN